jgi:hypothetical protein
MAGDDEDFLEEIGIRTDHPGYKFRNKAVTEFTPPKLRTANTADEWNVERPSFQRPSFQRSSFFWTENAGSCEQNKVDCLGQSTMTALGDDDTALVSSRQMKVKGILKKKSVNVSEPAPECTPSENYVLYSRSRPAQTPRKRRPSYAEERTCPNRLDENVSFRHMQSLLEFGMTRERNVRDFGPMDDECRMVPRTSAPTNEDDLKHSIPSPATTQDPFFSRFRVKVGLKRYELDESSLEPETVGDDPLAAIFASSDEEALCELREEEDTLCDSSDGGTLCGSSEENDICV